MAERVLSYGDKEPCMTGLLWHCTDDESESTLPDTLKVTEPLVGTKFSRFLKYWIKQVIIFSISKLLAYFIRLIKMNFELLVGI